MRNTENAARQPSTLLAPLRDEKMIVSWISELTDQPEDAVLSRLRQEYEEPGVNVTRAFAELGIERYVWSSGLERFYGETDAFLYELVVWNCNRLKRRMRRWLADYLTSCPGGALEVLCIGDGLGFDSAYIAQLAHNIAYFEVPGYAEAFARKVFAQCEVDVTVWNDPQEIPSGKYDVVICLDVLEHIHDLHTFVETMAGYLQDGGKFIVHAPFYMVHPSTPTHLRSNRKYCGDLSLFRKHKFELVDGDICWNPLVFEKRIEPSTTFRRRHILKLLVIRFIGLYFALGRFSILPFLWTDSYRRKHRHWFGG